MPEPRADSGVFIKPAWRRMPTGWEKVAALILSLLPVVALVCLTVQMGGGAHAYRLCLQAQEAELAQREAAQSSAALMLSAAMARSPSRPGPEVLPGKAGPEARAERPPAGPSWTGRYLLGRELASTALQAGAQALKLKVGAGEVPAKFWISWAILILLGPVFCFLGWRLRRVTTALLGAYAAGYGAFEVAVQNDMSIAGATVVALAPAFLGALIGWHLMVAFTTGLSGLVLAATAMAVILVKFGRPEWLPGPVMGVLLWSLATIVVYLFVFRAALISGWAVLGSYLFATALVLGLGCLVEKMPLWDIFMVLFGLLAALGTLTQYRFAARAAGEPPEPVAETA